MFWIKSLDGLILYYGASHSIPRWKKYHGFVCFFIVSEYYHLNYYIIKNNFSFHKHDILIISKRDNIFTIMDHLLNSPQIQDFVLNMFLRLLWIFGENPWLVLIWTFWATIWPVSFHSQHITASFSSRPLSSGFIKHSFPGPRILFKLMMCFSVFMRFLYRWGNHLFNIKSLIQVGPQKNILLFWELKNIQMGKVNPGAAGQIE